MRYLQSVLITATAFLVAGQHANAQQILPLWPASEIHGNGQAEKDTTTDKDNLIAEKRVQRLTNVSSPTIAIYPAPAGHNTGAAVIVFPGGGYRILAYDLEGTEVCTLLNSSGVNCILLKYRVPDAGPYPEHSEDLADAQRAVRMTRQHAVEWAIDPKRVGVLGFSAGGHLAAALSNQAAQKVYTAHDDADALSARPDFAVLIYPGLLAANDMQHLRSEVMPGPHTPPTFLVQAEDDTVHVENTTLYFDALKQAKAPAEMHVFAQGGHGYGLRPTKLPITNWPQLLLTWMRTIGVLT